MMNTITDWKSLRRQDNETFYSYKLIRRLNAELGADGFVTIKGRVST